MGKDMKVNHSVSSPPKKYGATFFVKKLCMVELFWANLWGDISYGDKWSDHAGGEKLTLQLGDWIWKTPAHYSLRFGDFM